jgi:hypothetical protein
MTGGEIMTVVGFFVMLFGFLFGLWRYIEAKIVGVRTESTAAAASATALAALAREELAAHKLHTAETYITKQGLRETTDQIMGAIGGVKAAVENMTLRVDRIVENQAKPRPPSRT